MARRKTNKKTVLLTAGAIVVLLGIHMITAWYLNRFYGNETYVCLGSEKLFHFHPEQNTAGSFLNLKFQIGYSKVIFILLSAMCVPFFVWLLRYFLRLKEFYGMGVWVAMSPVFFISAILGRIADRLLWEYTFDFIAVKNVGILDMGDVYLLVGCAVLIVTAVYMQTRENSMMRGMSREEKKAFKKKIRW